MKTRQEAERYIQSETDLRGRLSQRGRILQLLLSANEIELPAILDLRVSQYCARINELRGLGFDIRNRTERSDGTVHSLYSLIVEAPAGQSGDWYERQTGKPRPAPRSDFGPLFRPEGAI
jgi:hypothetical protein